jgi:multiple sugar transport system ATP-binding protein
MAEVILKKLKKKFGDFVAVNDMNLEIRDKEFIALVGPSGCGKTTILRMVAGLEEPTEGSVFIDGEDVTYTHPKDRNIAMVFQNYALYPHMNVYKNMSFGLRIKRYSKSEIEKRIKECARILSIEELLHRKPKELSGGQRQRVAIGRAIIRKPIAFLFDEPLSNLDAKLRIQMRGELAKLHNRLETTSIYVTHDQLEAMTLADRIVIMSAGSIMQIGAPLEVYEKPKNLFVAGFIGSPSMNFLAANIIEEDSNLKITGDNFSLTASEQLEKRFAKAKDRDVILGIRPEHIFDPAFRGDFAQGQVLQARIDVFEPIGSEVLLWASCGSNQILAKVDSHTKATVNKAFDFWVDTTKLHLFDRKTELAY